MSARDTVLTKIRTAMRLPSDDSARRTTVAARLSQPPLGVIPKRGQLPKDGQLELFCAMAAQFGATMTRVKDYKDVAGEVSAYLRARNLPAAIRVGADKRLKRPAGRPRRTSKSAMAHPTATIWPASATQ